MSTAIPTRKIEVEKVVINIGVGKGGEAIEKAKKALLEVAEQKPMATRAKHTIREFGIHQGEPIGVKLTLRGEKALKALNRLLDARGRKIPASSFDSSGNMSFGIREHIDIPGIRYKPDIGIFGMDVSVVLERPGYRVARRRRARRVVGRQHLVTKGEATAYAQEALGVMVT